MASVYPIEIDLATALASGNPITGVDWAVIDQMNAQHVHDHPTVDKAETIQLLRDNSKAAAARVRRFRMWGWTVRPRSRSTSVRR